MRPVLNGTIAGTDRIQFTVKSFAFFTFSGFLLVVRTASILNTWRTRVTVPGKALSYSLSVSRNTYAVSIQK